MAHRNSLLASAIAAALALPPSQALAQSAGGDDVLEEIIVTGTRRADRTVADSPVAIDVLDVTELTSTGFTETNQLLAAAVPSFNFPLPAITDGTDHIRPATLRGLAPDHTLVLINGKRRHTSALLNINGSVGRGSSAVDMNMIPAAAIKRIEVLRDGAAAQYGSDAIAGVINVILKDADSGGSVTGSYGYYDTELPGVPGVGNVSIDGAGNLVITDGPERSVATDGRTRTIFGDAGFTLGDGGFFHVSAEYRDRGPTNRAGYDPRNNYPTLPNGSADPREITFDRINHRFGNSDVQDLSLFYNAALPIGGGDTEIYSFGSVGDREGESGGFYRRAQDSRNVPEIYPDGFLPLITSKIDDRAFALGVRGTVSEWAWDASVVDGRNRFDYGVENSLNASLGPTSPTSFDAGGLENNQLTFNVDISRLMPVSWLPNDLALAFGAEYRKEQYSMRAGEPASYITGIIRDADGDPVLDVNGNTQPAGAGGAQVFPGFQPSNAIKGERDNTSVYVELDTDLTLDWSVAVAVRFEDYSDFGSTVNGKIASRHQHRVPRAVAGAIVLHDDVDQLHRWCTQRDRDVPGRCAGRRRAGGRAAGCRGVAEHQRRRRLAANRCVEHYVRFVPDRHR